MNSYSFDPGPYKGKSDLKILFVCLGNICRSPAAEGILRTMAPEGWTIDSAGTGGYHVGQLPDSRMRMHARRRDYSLTHHCRQVSDSDFRDFDLIFGMDDSNIDNLRRMCPAPELLPKIHRMAELFDPSARFDYVPDPYYEGSEGFELVLDLLEEGCRNLCRMLKP